MPTLTALTTSHGWTPGDLVTDGHVAKIPAFQSIWFADGRATGYWQLNFHLTKLSGVPSGTFSRGETFTQATSGAAGIFDKSIDNTHFVYRTTTTEFDTSHEITGATSGETVTPTAVTAPPHWIDWTTRRLSSPAAATGTIEDDTDYLPAGGANIGSLFNGRIFLNSIQNPNQWYASRHRDPEDWQVSQDDDGTPVSDQTAKLGTVGDAITAFVPYLDYYQYFGCVNEIWVLRGDPAAGGILTNVSREIGMFGPKSWTFDLKGNLYFMGMDGFYRLPAGAPVNQDAPESLTNRRVPNLVKSIGLNRRTDRVVMAYDADRFGIHVNISQMDGAWSTSFWWDARVDALMPDAYQSGQAAASMLYYKSRKASTRGILFGGMDGYVRTLDDTAKSDDGDNAIDAYCTLGPFQAQRKMRGQGQIVEMSLRLGDDTDGVDASLYGGDAAEAVVNAVKAPDVPQAAQTFTGGGRRPVWRPRTTAAVFALQLRNNTADERFAIEKVTARINDAGKEKG